MSKYSGLDNVFFSKDKKSANSHLKKLCKEEGKLYCNKKVKLNKKQVNHISGFKTWKIINK